MKTRKGNQRKVYSEKGHRDSAIRYIGGKSQLIQNIVPIIEFALEHYQLKKVYELFGGGARTLLNLRPSGIEERVYNDLDEGLADLFRCLSEPELLYDLIELLDDLGVGEDVFFQAKEQRENKKSGDAGYDLLTSAANTYITITQSFIARQKIFDTSLLKPNAKRNYIKRVRSLHEFLTTTEGITVTNRNALDILGEDRDWNNCLLYLDPSYFPTSMKSNNHYTYNLTVEEHEILIDRIIYIGNNFRALIVLSGYDNHVYERLVQAGWSKLFLKSVHVPSSGNGRHQDEFIWFNFWIPDALEEEVCELYIQD